MSLSRTSSAGAVYQSALLAHAVCCCLLFVWDTNNDELAARRERSSRGAEKKKKKNGVLLKTRRQEMRGSFTNIPTLSAQRVYAGQCIESPLEKGRGAWVVDHQVPHAGFLQHGRWSSRGFVSFQVWRELRARIDDSL